eukprot:356668-Amphidinium_carterae.1
MELWLHCHLLLNLQVDIETLAAEVEWTHPELVDRIPGWRSNGMIMSLHRSFVRLCELGVLRIGIEGGVHSYRLACRKSNIWERLLGAQDLSRQRALFALQARWDRVSRGEVVPPFVTTPSFLDKLRKSVKLVAKYQPAKAVAFSRCVFGALPQCRVHQHPGQCCACGMAHTGHHVIAALAR